MLQVLVLHLVPNPAQEKALFTTMHSFNRAANTVAQIAFAEHTRSIVKLQKRVYADVRSQFNLPAQLAITAISKAVRALQRDKNLQPVFEQEGVMLYDRKTLSFKGMGTVSLLTFAGRIEVAFFILGYHSAPLRASPGQHYLFVVNKEFYLAAVLDVPDTLPADAMRAKNVVDVEVLFHLEEMPFVSSGIGQVSP